MSDVYTIRITSPKSPSGREVVGVTPLPRPLTEPVTPAPRQLGEFRLLEVLGKGGMGIVYRAEEGRLGREVALKVLNPAHADSAESRARFQREARAQAAVEHDHVVPIFRVGEENGVPYLTMPVLKGVSLAQYLHANPKPPLAEVLRIGRELADGLAAAHAKGLVHRDVKPGNVWLEGPTGRVKILDFGLARELAPDDATSDPVTSEGVTVGTAEYMSPEQARGEPLDARTDVFSLGAVLYEMATGHRPFHGPNKGAMLARLLSNAPPPPREVNPKVSESLSGLILAMLEKDAKRRPASIASVCESLRRIETGSSRSPLSPRTKRNLTTALGVVAAIAAYLLVAPALGLPMPWAGPDLNRPEVLVRHLLRDFDRVKVRDVNGKEAPMQHNAPFPPAPFALVTLELPLPHANQELRRKLERGVPGPLKTVRFIDLSHTPATEAEARWISERLPRCEVRYRDGVVRPQQIE